MIEAKATSDDKRGGCEVSISMKGNGHELVEEALALIQGVLGSLKDEDAFLHLLAIQAIAEHREILLGKDEREERTGVRLAEMMSRHILKKGVN